MNRARAWVGNPSRVVAAGFGVYAIAFTVWAVLGVGSLRERTVISDLAFVPITAVAAFFAVQARRLPSIPDRHRQAWLFIAAAFLAWWSGDVLWAIAEVVRRKSPFPSPADAFYVCFYPLLLAGILLLVPAPGSRVGRARVTLDVLTITAVGGMLTWYFVVRSVAAAAEPNRLAQVLNLAYPTGDVLLVMSCALALIRRWRTPVARSLQVLAVGASLFVAADVSFARLSLSDRYGPGTGPDVLWMWALFLFLVAPLVYQHYAPRLVDDVRPWIIPGISPLPFVALLAEFILLLQVVSRQGTVVTVLLAGSMAVTVLVAAGQVLALRQNALLIHEREDAEAATRRFLDNAAHQLRTPIAGIQACAEMLGRGATPSQTERLLAALLGETKRAGQLIADLLQLARLDRAPAMNRSPTDLVALVEEEVERFRTKDGVTVDVVATRAMDPVAVDANAVHEALANILENAVRHARERIEVRVVPDTRVVDICVEDDGAGLDPAAAEQIFERFVSFDGGSGLGLAIARGLAQAHGGDVTYENAAFVIRLPLHPV